MGLRHPRNGVFVAHRFRSALLPALLMLSALLLLGACAGGGGDPVRASGGASAAAPLVEPVATPTPLFGADVTPDEALNEQARVTPLPTPTIVPFTTQADAESVVLDAVASCAGGVAGGGSGPGPLRLLFESGFSGADRA